MDQVWRLIAERRIQEAIDEGKFDNLPGKGKPINLEEDTSTPAHLRVANRILKNAGVLPDWMQLDSDIERTRDEVRKSWTRLEAEYTRRKARAVSTSREMIGTPEKRQIDFAKWLIRERSSYLHAIRRVNTDITKLLMIAPSVPRVHVPYKVPEETLRFDAAFPPLPGVDAPLPPEPQRDDAVRETVRNLYAARLHARNR